MLSLVATSVYSSLSDWRNGHRKVSEFNADLLEDVYNSHEMFLNDIREASITKYHRLMADLYKKCSSGVTGPTIVTNNARVLLNLDGMEE